MGLQGEARRAGQRREAQGEAGGERIRAARGDRLRGSFFPGGTDGVRAAVVGIGGDQGLVSTSHGCQIRLRERRAPRGSLCATAAGVRRRRRRTQGAPPAQGALRLAAGPVRLEHQAR